MGQLKECNPSMTIVDIPKFETANELSISVYTMAQDGVMVYPLHMSKKTKFNQINLLLIEGEENNHYTYIKDYNRLLRKPNESNTKVFCPYCCYGFCTTRNGKLNLAEHKVHCRPHGAQRTKYLPEGENIIQFKEFEKMQKAPFAIYADFETFNVKVEEPEEDAIIMDHNWDPIGSGCEIKTNHEVSGFTFYSVSDYFGTKRVSHQGEHGENVGEAFLKLILEEKKRILNILEEIKPKNLSRNKKKAFKQATQCHICTDPFLGLDDSKGYKVRIRI